MVQHGWQDRYLTQSAASFPCEALALAAAARCRDTTVYGTAAFDDPTWPTIEYGE